MFRKQRCLQPEAICSGCGCPRTHPITLKTGNRVTLAQLTFVYSTAVCSSLEDNFQVLSIEGNTFKIISLPIICSLPSPTLPAPTLMCIHTDTHTHAHTNIHRCGCICYPTTVLDYYRFLCIPCAVFLCIPVSKWENWGTEWKVCPRSRFKP